MDTFNEVMTELLIEQADRILAPVGKNAFAYIALKAEKVIVNGTEGESNVNKN